MAFSPSANKNAQSGSKPQKPMDVAIQKPDTFFMAIYFMISWFWHTFGWFWIILDDLLWSNSGILTNSGLVDSQAYAHVEIADEAHSVHGEAGGPRWVPFHGGFTVASTMETQTMAWPRPLPRAWANPVSLRGLRPLRCLRRLEIQNCLMASEKKNCHRYPLVMSK